MTTPTDLLPHIESLIFASDRPLTSAEITELINAAFGFMEDKVVPEQINALLGSIVDKYDSEFYPFEVRQSGGGWQFLTKKEYHKTVAQLNGEKFLKRLSGATLETLAIIAYKQPITKGEVESIRGVSSDYSVQKLLEKELVVISGRNEAMPGHPLIYNTSKTFMDYFGINSPEDLPKIKEVLANIAVAPTDVSGAEAALAVAGNGELVASNGEQEIAGAKVSDNREDTMAAHKGTQPETSSATDDAEAGRQEPSEEEKEALKAVDETGTDVDGELEAPSGEESPANENAEDEKRNDSGQA